MSLALEIAETGDQMCPPVAAGESREFAAENSVGVFVEGSCGIVCAEELFSSVGSLFWKSSFILQQYWNLKEIRLCRASFSH